MIIYDLRCPLAVVADNLNLIEESTKTRQYQQHQLSCPRRTHIAKEVRT